MHTKHAWNAHYTATRVRGLVNRDEITLKAWISQSHPIYAASFHHLNRTMPAVGKRIRDIERALRKATASSDSEKETALRETLQRLHEEKKQNEINIREKNNSQKYHMVRFVERQKVHRITSYFSLTTSSKSFILLTRSTLLICLIVMSTNTSNWKKAEERNIEKDGEKLVDGATR